jgi:hypothetical protein
MHIPNRLFGLLFLPTLAVTCVFAWHLMTDSIAQREGRNNIDSNGKDIVSKVVNEIISKDFAGLRDTSHKGKVA